MKYINVYRSKTTLPFSQKLLICRNRQYRTTLWYIDATQTNRSNSNPFLENLFIWPYILTKFGIDYYSKQRYNLRINGSNRTTIGYSCHINGPISLKSLYGKHFYLTILSILLNLAQIIAQSNATISEHIVQIKPL